MRILLFIFLPILFASGQNAVLLDSATQTLLQTNGGGGGTNFNGIFVTNSIFGTNYIYGVTTNNLPTGIVSREILTNVLEPIVALVATNVVWTNNGAGSIFPVDPGYTVVFHTNKNAAMFITEGTYLSGQGIIFADSGSSGIRSYVNNTDPLALSGANEGAGVVGAAFGQYAIQYGIVGNAEASVNGQTNVGVGATSEMLGSSGVFVGGYFAITTDDSVNPQFEDGALLLDNWDTGKPLLVARTNNATTVFRVDGVGDLTKLKSVPYSWPSAQGAATSVLTNDGSGVLGWGLLLFQPPSLILSNVVANTFTTNLNTNFNTLDGSFTDIANTNQVMADFESGATNTFLLLNNYGQEGTAGLILRNTNSGWRVSAQGITNRLLIQEEGIGAKGGFIADPSTSLFFIGDTTSDVILKEVSDGNLSLYRHDQNQYASITASNAQFAGKVAITNGGLVIQNFNSTSNYVWTCTNSTTGEGEWRSTAVTGSSYLFNTNQFATNTSFDVAIEKAAKLTNVVIRGQTNFTKITMQDVSIDWGSVSINEASIGSTELDVSGDLRTREFFPWDISVQTNLDLPFSAVSIGQVWTLTNVTLGRGSWSNAVALGETNFNGEVSVTNATRMGLVYGKSDNTNLVRSVQGGNGILNTNQGTNIMFAIDPAVVASQANLTAESNALVTLLVANDTTTSNGAVSFTMTASNSLYTTTINGLTNKIENLNGVGTNTTFWQSAITKVAQTIRGITGNTSNLTEWLDTNGNVQAALMSNGLLRVPMGSVTAVSIGNTNTQNNGIYFPATTSVGIVGGGTEGLRVSFGAVNVGANNLAFGSGLANTDYRFIQAFTGVINEGAGNIANSSTNRMLGTAVGQVTVVALTNAEWAERGYDNVNGWFFLRSQKGSSNGTARPLVLSANGIANDIQINTNHSVTLPNSVTNQSYTHFPSNAAPYGIVAPANLHSVAMAANFTNDLGSRALLVITCKLTDAVSGDSAWMLTNFSSGMCFTNALTFALSGSEQQTVTVPVSPNDFGRLVDLSGTGASATVVKAYWVVE